MAKRVIKNANPALVKTERAYSASIAPLGTAAITATTALVTSKLSAIVGDPESPNAGWRARLDRELKKATARTWRAYTPRRAATAISTQRQRVDRMNLATLTGQIRKGADSADQRRGLTAAVGEADTEDVASSWDEAQVGVLTGSVDQHMDRTKKAIIAAVAVGAAIAVIRSRSEDVHGMTRRGLVNSATDWTGKLNAGYTEVRWENANVRRYKWITVGDDDVREEHEARSGKIFKWSDPPSDGHPGEPHNCRCESQPMITSSTRGKSPGVTSKERQVIVAKFKRREIPMIEDLLGRAVKVA